MHQPTEASLPAPTNEELIELLRRAKSSQETERDSVELQEEIVRRNVGLVKSVAVKFLGSGEPLDDLIQAGYIGLLNAVANFDLARNTRFSTYASYLIQGEIRHYIRDKHSTIRIPQWVQTMNRRVKEAEEAFFQQKGRPPALSELASSLDLSNEQLTALLRGRKTMTYVSIDQQRRTSDPSPAPPAIEHLVTKSDDLPFDVRMRILITIEQLTELQRQVIEGLFYQGKSQSEIGKELGVSQRQISRLKERILSEMKDRLGPTPDN
jgi:RNA polymerase sigma-B factor